MILKYIVKYRLIKEAIIANGTSFLGLIASPACVETIKAYITKKTWSTNNNTNNSIVCIVEHHFL